MTNLRITTVADFKRGSMLMNSEGFEFILTSKYDDGIWESKSINGRGGKVIFENEARFYKIKS